MAVDAWVVNYDISLYEDCSAWLLLSVHVAWRTGSSLWIAAGVAAELLFYTMAQATPLVKPDYLDKPVRYDDKG